MKARRMSEGLEQVLRKAQHDPVAAYDAAIMLEYEHRSQNAAQYFFLSAANGGYAPAMLRVAGLYFTGRFLSELADNKPCYILDIEKGTAWLRRAYETGDTVAAYMLARCYADGLGVPKDSIRASYFMSKVPFANQGNPYSSIEALIFGDLSENLQVCITRKMKEQSLRCAENRQS